MFPDNTITPNMTIAVNGTLQSNTSSWNHGLDAGVFVIIPVTFVALLSIIAVAISINPAGSNLHDDEFTSGAGDAILFNSLILYILSLWHQVV